MSKQMSLTSLDREYPMIFVPAFEPGNPRSRRGFLVWLGTQPAERIPHLERAVAFELGIADLRATLPQSSLATLGRWLAAKCVCPTVDQVDRDALASMIFDVAVFYAQALISARPQVEWAVDENRRSMDYGSPVLSGFPNGGTVNPFRQMKVLAAHWRDGKEASDAIATLFGRMLDALPS